VRALRSRHALLACVLWATAALADGTPPTPSPATPVSGPPADGRRSVTATRFVGMFGGLEREVADAVKSRETAALDRLLVDEFELLSASHPDQPVDRDAWQDSVLGTSVESFKISNVSVHMVGESAALVAFSYEQRAKAPAHSGRFTFVDLWRRENSLWRLHVRYAASAGEATVPGWAPQPVFEKR
jgi:hypothetical protein